MTRSNKQLRTVNDVTACEHHLGVRLDDAHFCHTAYYDIFVVLILNCAEFIDFDDTVVVRLHVGNGCHVACHTTDVERTECKLSTRFTDSLCCDNAHGFTLLNHAVGSKVAAVTLGANASLGFASEHRTDFNRFDSRFVDALGCCVVDFFAAFHYYLTGKWVYYVVHRYTAQDTVAK